MSCIRVYVITLYVCVMTKTVFVVNYILFIFLIVSGNGVCNCSVCVCNEGYNGTRCECPTSTDMCRNNNGVSNL